MLPSTQQGLAAGSMAVHSRLVSCSISEVHVMIEMAMRHGTSLEVEWNSVELGRAGSSPRPAAARW
jgi:hypothetical protein